MWRWCWHSPLCWAGRPGSAGSPTVADQIVAGILLGLSLLGHLPGHLTSRLFPSTVLPYLTVPAQVAVAIFMFVVGYEINWRSVAGQRRSALFVAVAALVLPMGLGSGVVAVFRLQFADLGQAHVGHSLILFMGIALSITALPDLAAILLRLAVRHRGCTQAIRGRPKGWTPEVLGEGRVSGALRLEFHFVAKEGVLDQPVGSTSRPDQLIVQTIGSFLPREGRIMMNGDRWIRRFHESEKSAARLVCFPHAGGSASYYFAMSKALAPHIELLAVQYPGRQDRRGEALIDDLVRLADLCYDHVTPWLDRSFAFFGHSMGALVAFEVTRRLEERTGTSPVRLFASGRRAPSLGASTNIHRLDDQELAATMVRAGGTDPRLFGDSEMLATVLRVTRNDYRAVETYVYAPGPPLRSPVTVLVGDADPQTSLADAAAWRAHSAGAFQLSTFPGGHFYLEAHRDQIVREISVALPPDAAASAEVAAADEGATR